MKPRQLSLLTQRLEHGGEIRAKKRKLYRPIDPKRPLHLVMRSSRAHGDWSMLLPRHEKQIQNQVRRLARRFRVKVYRYANSGNHLHLLIKGEKREGIQRFLKAATGVVARIVTGAKKGVKKGKFWDALVYSKVVTWGREFRNVHFYLIRNELEGLGWRDLTHHPKTCHRPNIPP